MEEELMITNAKIDRLKQRIVLLFIQSNYTLLQGNWQWELHADAVFCSDVILSAPVNFHGTKSIIHPDDLELLKNNLSSLSTNKNISLRFRIITTYGEIKTLNGEDVILSEEVYGNTYPETDLLKEEIKHSQLLKEKEAWQLKQDGYQFTERLAELGTWYINTTTNETVYSDQVFHIYGVQPQSLNMHPNTFSSFVHYDDQAIVSDFLDKAYREKLTLHLEFRIIRPNGEERFVRQSIQWSLGLSGAYILHGVIQDITDSREQQQMLEQALDEVDFWKKVNKLKDQDTNSGHWYMNLLLRKTVFSDNVYRIFGLRPQSIPSEFTILFKSIHLDDQNAVEQALRKARIEHAPIDITYRIMRPDGKTRYIRQTGKLEIYGNNELVLVGTIQDISQQKALEDKVYNSYETEAVKHFIREHLEKEARSGSLVWDLQSDKVSWSNNLYQLLGHRSTLEPRPKLILSSIHPEDHKKYNNEVNLVMQTQERDEFEIRIIAKAEIRHVKTKLTLLSYNSKNFLVGIFLDVTEEVKQQQQLAEKMQLAKQLTENLPDSVMITNSYNNIILWNNACEVKYKRKKEEIEGVNFFDVFPGLKNEETINSFNEVLHGKEVKRHHLPTALKGYNDWSMIPLKDKNEAVIGILHIIQDVTGEYKLRQQLSERLIFIEKLVDITVDRIIVLDKNMNYLYWNSRSEEFYGYKKEQVVGKNILEVFPALMNDPSYNEFKKAMRGETVHMVESDTEGGYYYETYLLPVKNEKEEVTAILWITHDFSKEYRLLAEQKIAHEILDTVDEACFELDYNSRLLYVNKKAEEFWNKSRQELLGKNLWDIFPEAIDAPLYIALNTVLQDRVEVQQEFLSPIQKRWIYVLAKPSEKGIVVVFLDIHQLKQNQEKIVQVLNALNEGYYELDKEYRITFANQHAQQFFSEEKIDIVGKAIWDVSPHIKESPLYNAMVKVMEEGQAVRDNFLSPLKGINCKFTITPASNGIAVIFLELPET